jgi:ureidoglycolate dehydrogenase (NAD+)
MIKLGLINKAAEPRVIQQVGAAALLEGDKAAGAAALNLATTAAVALAREYKLGCCSARNITHAGAIGFFAEKIARQDCIGIVMTASKPLMAYHGSRVEGVSTNPIAISVPTEQAPVTLDMSTASAALGKIMAARDAGRVIPEGWGIDESGAATTDPARVKALLPMSGPKGSGLSLMIEVLCSVFAGNPIVSRALAKQGDAGFNGMVLAIDASTFAPAVTFRALASELMGAVKQLPPAPGVEEILLPGERAARMGSISEKDGILLLRGTAARLRTLAAELGVREPKALSDAQ